MVEATILLWNGEEGKRGLSSQEGRDIPIEVDSSFLVGPLSTPVDLGLKIYREPSRLSRL